MKELDTQPVQEQITERSTENTASFVNNIRSAIAKEAKLTFSLPRFGYGITKDTAMKAYGFGSVGLWTKVAIDQSSNELLHSGKEIALTAGFASSMALAGLATVIWANRLHEENNRIFDQVQAELDEPS